MLHPNNIPDMEARLSESGASVADICEKVGIAKTTWWRWKNGHVSPTVDTWDNVVAAYDSLVSGKVSDDVRGAS